MDSAERADDLSGVYVIQCVPTGQVYVGSTESVRTRKAAHWRELRAGRHANRALQQAWLTYGDAAFTFEVAEAVIGVAALREKERAHMERLRAREPEHGFNFSAPWATAVSERYCRELARMLKALADESRLRIVGLLVTSERSVEELAALLKLGAPTVSHHLAMLREAGLVTMRPEGNARIYRLNGEGLGRINRLLSAPEHVAALAQPEEGDAWERKVLRDFFEDGRLKQIPARLQKRRVILKWLCDQFEYGRTYTEKEVNELIRRYHPDTAALRRELIDERFMDREAGVYWRRQPSTPGAPPSPTDSSS